MLGNALLSANEGKKRAPVVIPKRLSALVRRETSPPVLSHNGGVGKAATPYEDEDPQSSWNPDDFDPQNINNQINSIGNVMMINNPLMRQKNEDLRRIMTNKKRQLSDGMGVHDRSYVRIEEDNDLADYGGTRNIHIGSIGKLGGLSNDHNLSRGQSSSGTGIALTMKSGPGSGVKRLPNPLQMVVDKKVKRNKTEYKKLLGITTPPKRKKSEAERSPSKISNNSIEKEEMNALRKSKNSQS